MNAPYSRPSRPRRYDLQPAAGWANPFAAYAVAALNELSARLFDLIADMPQEAMDFVPDGAGNTMAMLTIHMAWAEAFWISRITGHPIPPDLQPQILPGRQGPSGDLSPFSAPADQLIELCRRVRQELTYPALSTLHEVDAEIPDEQRPMTARGVLMHVIWHWTYHSGQVGLLRRLWGSRYKWTFDRRVGAPAADR
jgi:uncharacterized damage-inducible protein DinB